MGRNDSIAHEPGVIGHRLALGTVQFGLPYGIANRTGVVSATAAAAILSHAESAGFDTLDTAIAYGASEQRLGEIGVGRWRVISKLPPMPEPCTNVKVWVNAAVHASLQRLRIRSLYGLLLHNSRQLLGAQGNALYRALTALKLDGTIDRIGVSIYDPEELDALYPRLQLDLVQAPLNIMDRRLLASGWLNRLHAAGVEVHVRSAFLQGLLLMNDATRPAQFNRWRSLWDEWQRWLNEQALHPLQACLGYLQSQPQIDRVVVGVDSVQQLREILASAGHRGVNPPAELMSEDPELINPSRWNSP